MSDLSSARVAEPSALALVGRSKQGFTKMDEQPNAAELRRVQARLLAKETEVSEEQVLDLIEMIGTDRSSLIREIEIMKKSGGKSPEA
jgi:hypothetical protein